MRWPGFVTGTKALVYGPRGLGPGEGSHGQAVGRVEIDAAGYRDLLRDALGRSVVWVLVVGPLLAACWYVGAQRSLGLLTLGVYAAAVGLLILCEYWLCFNEEWGSAIRGSRTDLLYAVIATLMDKASFVLCVTAIASLGRHLAGVFEISLWPTGWNRGLQVVVALFIADAAAYLRHRLFHSSSALWRFHRIHHSMTALYWIRLGLHASAGAALYPDGDHVADRPSWGQATTSSRRSPSCSA